MIVDSKQASINREILSRFEQLQRCTQVNTVEYFG